MDVVSFWGILGVKNWRSNLENNQNDKKCLFPTGNDISQPFKLSPKKFTRKGFIVNTLLKHELKLLGFVEYRIKIIYFMIYFPNLHSEFLCDLVGPKQNFKYEKCAQTTIRRSREMIVSNIRVVLG